MSRRNRLTGGLWFPIKWPLLNSTLHNCPSPCLSFESSVCQSVTALSVIRRLNGLLPLAFMSWMPFRNMENFPKYSITKWRLKSTSSADIWGLTWVCLSFSFLVKGFCASTLIWFLYLFVSRINIFNNFSCSCKNSREGLCPKWPLNDDFSVCLRDSLPW